MSSVPPITDQIVRHLPRWLADAGSPPLLLTHTAPEILDEGVAVLLQAAYCQTAAPAPCGHCEACRAVREGRHPDITTCGTETATITIKQVRSIIQAATQTPLKARWRLLVIPHAERLSLPAANALLKVLEEASHSTRFILSTRWRRRILPTILSRSEHIRLRSARVPTPAVSPPWEADLMHRLAASRGDEGISDEMLSDIAAALADRLRQDGATAELRRAYQRLRDYCAITQRAGTSKAARDVLLASLPDYRA